MDMLSMIALWRERAAEVKAQALGFQDGSISNTVLLTIAESYERLASREERLLPRPRRAGAFEPAAHRRNGD
jgi:hypothetical protein